MAEQKKRIPYLDVLNIIAILAVVFMHHNSNVHFYSDTTQWKTSLIVETIFYFAVPLFLMITGSTLLGYRKKYTTKTFFKKRALKVLVPSLAWMLIMFVWHVFIRKDMVITNWSIPNIINIFMSSKENSVYYYLFVIMGVYLTIPILAPLAEEKYRKVLWYGVIGFFIFNTLLPDLLKFAGVNWNGDLSLWIGKYIPYLFLGHLLSTQEIKKKYRIILYVGGVLAILYRYLTTYFLSMGAGTIVKTTWGYSSFHAIILTAAVFVFVKNMSLEKLSERMKNVLAKLASCSFGVYLSHMLILHYESGILSQAGISTSSAIYRFICPLLTYVACIGLILVLKKIPLIRKIVP